MTAERLLEPFSAELAAALQARRDDLVREGQLLPGAAQALAAVAKLDGVVQTVLTGNSRPSAMLKLRAFGLDGFVDFDIGGYGSEAYPKGTLLRVARQRAADKHGVSFGEDVTVYVADSPRDVDAARIGGARSLAVASGRASAAELREAGADAVLPDLTDTAGLTALITRLTEPPADDRALRPQSMIYHDLYHNRHRRGVARRAGWHDAESMEASEGDLPSRGYGAVLWEPDDKTVRDARITRFMSWLADRRELRFGGYEDLWQWSVTEPAAFWSAVWDYFEVLGDRGDGPALAGEVMPDVRWFDGATLNYARNALRTAWTDPDRTAIIFDSERGRAGSLTYAELAAEVARVARACARSASARGDRVAALLPNVPEAVIGLLASREPGRDLVVVLAGLRRAQRDRPVRADRAEGAHRLRRLRVRRQGVLPRRDAPEVVEALPGLSAVVLVSLSARPPRRSR